MYVCMYVCMQMHAYRIGEREREREREKESVKKILNCFGLFDTWCSSWKHHLLHLSAITNATKTRFTQVSEFLPQWWKHYLLTNTGMSLNQRAYISRSTSAITQQWCFRTADVIMKNNTAHCLRLAFTHAGMHELSSTWGRISGTRNHGIESRKPKHPE